MTQWSSLFVRRTVAALVVVLAMSGASASAGPILSINPATTTVNVDGIVTLNIDITEVVDLYTYSFELVYDPLLLSFVEITEGVYPNVGLLTVEPDWFIAGEACASPSCEFELSDAHYGKKRVTTTGATFFTSEGPGVSGDGTLAIAKFLAINAGTSSVFLTEPLFFNTGVTYDLLGNPTSGHIAFSAVNGSAQVTFNASTVPDEPSAIVLLVAVVALAACRRFHLT